MVRRLFQLMALLMMGACGGGGAASPPTMPPPTNSDPGVPLNSANAVNSAVVSVSLVEASVQLALAAVNPFIDAIEDDLLSLTVACGSGGNVSVSILDRDSSAAASIGDTATVVWGGGCFSGELNAVADGTISLTLLDYWKGNSGALFFVADVTLSDFIISGTATSTTNAAFQLDLVMRHSNVELLQIHVNNSRRLRIEVPSAGLDESMTAALIRRELFSSATGTSDRPYTVDASLTVSSGFLGGDLNCSTPRTLASPNSSHEPLSGEFLCTGATLSKVRVNSDRVDRTAPITLEVDVDGSGGYVGVTNSNGNRVFWSDLAEGGLFTSRLRIPASAVVPSAPTLTPLIVPLAVNDMQYAAGVDRVYATTDTAFLELDPDTLQILRTLAVADRPGAVGLSDDETVAWIALDDVSRLQKIDLLTMTTGTSFALGDSTIAGFGPRDVYRIRVAPGSTDLVVVSTPNAVEMIAYNNGVQLPNIIDDTVTTFSPPRLFLFSDPTRIVAQDNSSTAYSVFRINLDPVNGLSLDAEFPFLSDQSRNRLKSGSQYVFASSGSVFDANNGLLIGTFKQSSYFYDDLDVDVSAGIVIAMSSIALGKFIDILDESNFRLLGHYQLPPNTPNIRFEPVVLTTTSLLFKQGNELKRIDRTDLVANASDNACTRLDLSGILVTGTYLSFDCGFTDVAYDITREQLYVATDGSSENGNSIAIIDVTTMQLGQHIQLSGRPSAIRLSADNSTLFVAIANSGRYVEIDLETNSVANEVLLGSEPSGPFIANSIAASRGPDGDLIVSMNADVALYGNGNRIGVTASMNRKYSDIYVSAGGTSVWGQDSNSLDEYLVSSSGIVALQSLRDMLYPSPAAVRNNTLYSADGRFFEMDSALSSVGCADPSVAGILGTRVGADHLSERLFYAWVDYQPKTGSRLQLATCDTDTLAIGPLSDTYMFGSFFDEDTVSVIPLSGNRIAVLGEDKLFILDRP
jgi:hypothetical protein